MTKPHIFWDVKNSRAPHVLPEELSHKILNVLRLQKEDEFIINTPYRRQFLAKITDVRGRKAIIEIIKEIPFDVSLPQIWACIPLIKKEKLEAMARFLTQIGAARIIVFRSQRSILKKQAFKKERLLKVIKNCTLHPILPAIDGPVTFEEVINSEAETKLIMEGSGELLEKISLKPPVAFLIGPEGGFTEKEVKNATEKGWKPASLGPTVLYTEHALFSAASRIMGRLLFK